MTMDNSKFIIDCTGDVVIGDTILFTEIVWGGSYKNPTNKGKRTIIAKVVRDSYGEKKQQHTFSIKIIDSDGVCSLSKNITTTRKGRNIYKNGTMRLSWECEEDRNLALNEKHSRGDLAIGMREIRRNGELFNSW